MRTLRTVSLSIPLLALLAAARPVRAEWALGPLGGANISNADIEGREGRAVTSWDVGARLQMGVAPVFSLMLDPMLVQSRTDFDMATGEGRGDFVSLDLPVLLNARLNLLNLGLYGFIGPNFMFTTGANGDDDGNALTGDDLNPVVLAGQVGAGLAVGVAPFIDVTADARYTHGFTDLLAGAKDDIEHWRTRDVRLNLGVLLHTPRMGALIRPGNAFRTAP